MARILQVCNADFTLRIFIAPLVRALSEAGHEVTCVCNGTDIPSDVLGENVVIEQFAFPRRASPAQFALNIHAFRKVIAAGPYDCVNSHNRDASVVARVAAWLERVPINLYTAHGCYFHDGQARWLREATIYLERLLARITDHTLSQSQEDTDLLIERGIVARSRITTIGNGIDTERFRPDRDTPRSAIEAELGLAPCSFRIGAIGRLVEAKGFTDLLEAFAHLCGSRDGGQLLLIGGNIEHDQAPFQDRFLRRADELGVRDRIVVTGITSHVERYLNVCDAFVLPSYREGMPRALLEAMAMEVPSIATNIRGCREIIQDGVNGFLYPPRAVGALTALLEDLRSEKVDRNGIGGRARARVEQHYTERGYVERQVCAIEELLAAKEASD